MIEFRNILAEAGLVVFLRLSRGDDKMAACGQLGEPGNIQAPMLRVPEQFRMAVWLQYQRYMWLKYWVELKIQIEIQGKLQGYKKYPYCFPWDPFRFNICFLWMFEYHIYSFFIVLTYLFSAFILLFINWN